MPTNSNIRRLLFKLNQIELVIKYISFQSQMDRRSETPPKEPFNPVYAQLANSAHSPHRSFHLERKGMDTEVVIIKSTMRNVRKAQLVHLIERNQNEHIRKTTEGGKDLNLDLIREKWHQLQKLKSEKLELQPKQVEQRELQIAASQLRQNLYELHESQKIASSSRTLNIVNNRADHRNLMHLNKQAVQQSMDHRHQLEMSRFRIHQQQIKAGQAMKELLLDEKNNEKEEEEILQNIQEYLEKVEQARTERIREEALHAVESKELSLVQEENMLTAFQIAVLKMQISPNLRISFQSLFTQIQSVEQSYIFSKDKLIWPQTKVKKMSVEEIKYHMVLQLYSGWKKWMHRLSFNFDGYKTILFFKNNENTEHKSYDLQQLMQLKKNNRNSFTSKRKQYLVYYSPISQRFDAFLDQLSQKLRNLHNNILKITSVVVSPSKTELIINYLYLGSEQRSKKWEIVKLQQLTRDSLLKYVIPNRDRIVTAKIEIPAVIDKLQIAKYEQVYDLIRKQK